MSPVNWSSFYQTANYKTRRSRQVAAMTFARYHRAFFIFWTLRNYYCSRHKVNRISLRSPLTPAEWRFRAYRDVGNCISPCASAHKPGIAGMRTYNMREMDFALPESGIRTYYCVTKKRDIPDNRRGCTIDSLPMADCESHRISRLAIERTREETRDVNVPRLYRRIYFGE